MLNISVEKTMNSNIEIRPMSIKRDWMDNTAQGHAYRCFPVTQANVIGWSLSSTKDIRFTWNGTIDQTSDTVTITEGSDFAYTGRGQGTVSFNTGLVFKTESNISLFTINPVNYFNNDFEVMSSLVSTSFYDNPIPLAIRAKTPNQEIIIKAGSPLATIIPISLTSLDNTSIEIFDYVDKNNKRANANKKYGEAAQAINQTGGWTDWYRNAVNEKGDILGEHETKTLKLSVKDSRKQEGFIRSKEDRV
jgi:hypothetical protein